METHAHHLHKAPGKKWTHYLFEFFMLFLAVFCGFLAENIRDHKVERQKEKEYIQSLVEDLKKDTSDLNSAIEACTQKQKGFDSLAVVCFSYNNTDSINREMYHLYFNYALNRPNMFFHKATIVQLKNSGGLRLIRKQLVMDSILEYDTFSEFVISQANVFENLFSNAYQLGWQLFNGKFIHRDPGIGKRSYLDSSRSLPLLSSDHRFINLYGNNINSLISIVRGYISLLEGSKQKAAVLVSLLKKEYYLK